MAADLNHLEQWKQSANTNSAHATQVKVIEKNLATALSSLTQLVYSNTRVARECALTAFSLDPTDDRFDVLGKLQEQFETEQVVIKTEPQLPVSPLANLPLSSSNSQATVLIKVECTGSSVVGEPPPGSGGGPGPGGGEHQGPGTSESSATNDPLTMPFTSINEAVEDVDSGVDINDVTNVEVEREVEDTRLYTEVDAESLGVSSTVIKDLSVVVHSCRWEVLTWRNGWEALAAQCTEYLADPAKMRNVTKDLKYLKLDYSQFDHLPPEVRDEYWGIEKGYENCYEDDGGAGGTSVASTSSRRPSDTKRKKDSSSAPKKKKPAKPKLLKPGSESSGPEDFLVRKKVPKKKPRRALPLKLSSDSDSSVGIKTEPGTSPIDEETLKRSARIKASKVLISKL